LSTPDTEARGNLGRGGTTPSPRSITVEPAPLEGRVVLRLPEEALGLEAEGWDVEGRVGFSEGAGRELDGRDGVALGRAVG